MVYLGARSGLRWRRPMPQHHRASPSHVASPAPDCWPAGGQVLRPPAALPPEPHLRPRRRRDRTLHDGWLGRPEREAAGLRWVQRSGATCWRARSYNLTQPALNTMSAEAPDLAQIPPRAGLANAAIGMPRTQDSPRRWRALEAPSMGCGCNKHTRHPPRQ